jgi:2-iminobutanoate/2-iminopropanoate deaminase
MPRETITSPNIPTPVAPFSPAVRAGEFVYLSGQVGQDPGTGLLVRGGISAQVDQTLRNLQAVLEAAGKSFGDVIQVRVFLADMGDFAAMNEVYARHFEAPYPARTTVAVAGLPLGAAVEIDMVAR